ncbi:unnamed protein product [Rotaria magnacalcarata]|uniref:K Homology domain-containing protein n=1 Tax=Rotaria magnacalcarata TaxID=392030 RepID=A0A816WGV4_9BILA|nr:unnamed protein product [Rotaria magnacalcarata]CAF1451041.1 unnamed protein product [Rotaria magnacalcarata]CAF2125864.1 unnamed protein product [Rotaria magnacalcarata]CAF2145674.1 unnamed protein product [Rotaria magnacalcarata]CAF4087262.1 unnamed protein product [Rotaria magnacalcarata]
MKDQTNEAYTNLKSFSRPCNDQYIQLKDDLGKWHYEMIELIQDMYLNTLIELDTSYERLDTFRQTLHVLLDDESLADKAVSMTSSDIINISSRLSWIENEIDSISNLFFHINCQQVKLTDRPYLIDSNAPSIIPCRILIKREQADQLSKLVNNTLYTLLTHPSSPEAILVSNNVQQLTSVIQQILLQTNELRVLIHELYAPFIIGQLGSRAKMLKEKYALNNLKVYPTCAPLSTERIILLSGSKQGKFIECLTEIYQTQCQTSFINLKQQTNFPYSPEFYDVSLVDDYGGFNDRQVQLVMQRSMNTSVIVNNPNDEEDLNGYQDEDIEDFDNDINNYQTETVEPLRERRWTLSDAQAGALFGPNSSRLHQIRSESNAWIVIYEAEGKSTRRPMSIRGTKAEIEHATKLILETIKRHDRKLPLKYNHQRGK